VTELLVDPPESSKPPEIGSCGLILRIECQRLLEILPRGCLVARMDMEDAEVVPVAGVGWIDGQGGLLLADRARHFAHRLIDFRKRQMRSGVVWTESLEGLELPQRIDDFSRAGIDRREQLVGVGIVLLLQGLGRQFDSSLILAAGFEAGEIVEGVKVVRIEGECCLELLLRFWLTLSLCQYGA